jgi:hypothetical protein
MFTVTTVERGSEGDATDDEAEAEEEEEEEEAVGRCPRLCCAAEAGRDATAAAASLLSSRASVARTNEWEDDELNSAYENFL